MKSLENGVMLQSFEWEMSNDGQFYNNLRSKAAELKKLGFDSIWLPPIFKATGTNDVGYGVYDLYDLGEFNQKGDIRTKYGNKEELLELIQTLHAENILVYLDIVLNHKAGADYSERFHASKVDPNNRSQVIESSREIEAWTGFDFPGRNNVYSDFKWNFNLFTGVDYDQITGESAIFKIDGENKGWSYGVSTEKGNFDYLMFADIDHAHPEVRKELLRWSDWLIETTAADGFRMDAVKHIDDEFMQIFSEHVLRNHPNFYIFGEFWETGLSAAKHYLHETEYNMDIFDVPLHFNMLEASKNPNYDLRKIFDGTLVQSHPLQAVTFVDNHDSQPGQALESWVDRSFKEKAYALILLRKDGYPCVFAGDYYGIHNGDYLQEDLRYDIDRLLELRKNYAWGEQFDFFQDSQAIAWTRTGTTEHPGLLAVTMSMHSNANLELDFGPEAAYEVFYDYLNRHDGYEITLDENGQASFPVKAGSLSCWVNRQK